MPLCRLCHQERELRNSHIVPEFLYADLYNDKGHLMAVNGRGSKGWKPLQNGMKEYLFCEACEQHFNEHFEKPFLRFWVQGRPLPDPWIGDQYQMINADYGTFKLFHVSVVFRAGVSTLATFSEVSLGPHEERMRQMLLAREPGPETLYPIFGYAVVHHRTRAIIQMVSKAQSNRFGGRRCYGIMYGGVQWWTCVASDVNHEFQQVALRADGSMPIASVPWNEVSVVQEASRALRRADA
jgi:hypothetical protein